MLSHKNKIFNKDESYFSDDANLADQLNTTHVSQKFSTDQVITTYKNI